MGFLLDTVTHPLDLSFLNIDEAYLNVTTDSLFYLYGLYDECYKCPFYFIKEINQSQILKVPTTYGTSWRLYKNFTSKMIREHEVEDLICEVRPKRFGEFGVYEIIKTDKNCSIYTSKLPSNHYYLPLYSIALILIVLTLIWNIASKYIKCAHNNRENGTTERKSKRLSALDTFRGICIFLMIFVNDGAGHYAIINHTTWNGIHLADFLFPWFMWIMGVCIPISIKSQLKRKVPRFRVFTSILQRSLTLFLLGLALNTIGVGAQLESLRIFGVLQRFAITYFVVATFVTFLMLQIKPNSTVGPVMDIINLSILWVVMILIVAGQSYLTFYYPVPNCPIGYLGPGGIHYDGIYKDCVGGFAGYFDKLVLGKSHIYQNPTSNLIYHSGPFDPEGPFGCLLSIFQVFLGVQAGAIIISYSNWLQRIKRWSIWGAAFIIFGLVLCQARQEGGWIPLNKNLWSLSFVAVTSGVAFLLLSLLFYLIDHVKCWSGSPFLYPGMNAILLYVGHEICFQLFPWHWRYGTMNSHLLTTLEAFWGTILWTIISYWLYKKSFFLSL